jgi:hypothetical protein
VLVATSLSQTAAKEREPPDNEQPPYWLNKHDDPAARIPRCIVASHSAPLRSDNEDPSDDNRKDDRDASKLIHAMPVPGVVGPFENRLGTPNA